MLACWMFLCFALHSLHHTFTLTSASVTAIVLALLAAADNFHFKHSKDYKTPSHNDLEASPTDNTPITFDHNNATELHSHLALTHH